MSVEKKIRANIGLKFVSLIDLLKNQVMLIIFNENARIFQNLYYLLLKYKNTKNMDHIK